MIENLQEIDALYELLDKQYVDRDEFSSAVEKVSDSIDETTITLSDEIEEVRETIEKIELTPGPQGDSYILTEDDKKEIANKIEVPIVEKIIEKTEIVHEQPIVNEITNVIEGTPGKDGSPDSPVEVRDKLESLKDEERLDIKSIKGTEKLIDQPVLDRAIGILDQRTSFLINKVTNLANSTPPPTNPGGSTTQLQYNNNGAFGGVASIYNSGTQAVAFTGALSASNLSGTNTGDQVSGDFDHGGLTGLSDDDHTQYALLAGRATPQQFAFGTASGASTGYLTSTAHATKGKYFLNEAGTMTVDDLNERLGLGVAAPTTTLDMLIPSSATSGVLVTENYTGAVSTVNIFNLSLQNTHTGLGSHTYYGFNFTVTNNTPITGAGNVGDLGVMKGSYVDAASWIGSANVGNQVPSTVKMTTTDSARTISKNNKGPFSLTYSTFEAITTPFTNATFTTGSSKTYRAKGFLATVSVVPTAVSSGSPIFEAYGADLSVTGTTTGANANNVVYGLFIRKATGGASGKNYGIFMNETTSTTRHKLSNDSQNTYFGTGEDVFIQYSGTHWDFDVALATTAIRFNQSLIDTDFEVYGNDRIMLHLDANGGASYFQQNTDSTTAFQLRDAGGNIDTNYDSTNGRFGIGITAPTSKLHVVEARTVTTSAESYTGTEITTTTTAGAAGGASAFPSNSGLGVTYTATGTVLTGNAFSDFGVNVGMTDNRVDNAGAFGFNRAALRGLFTYSGTNNGSSGTISGLNFTVTMNSPTVGASSTLNATAVGVTSGGDMGTTGTTSHRGMFIQVTGTADKNSAIVIQTTNGATANYGIEMVETSTSLKHLLAKDSQLTYFGTGEDAGISFSGTQLLIRSDYITSTDSFQLRAGTNGLLMNVGATQYLALTANALTFADATDMVFNATTGTKIATATTQKIGFWNATPIVQPTTAVAAATFVTNTSLIANDTATFDGYTIGQVVKALRNAGLLA